MGKGKFVLHHTVHHTESDINLINMWCFVAVDRLDFPFNNLSGSHHQIQVFIYHVCSSYHRSKFQLSSSANSRVQLRRGMAMGICLLHRNFTFKNELKFSRGIVIQNLSEKKTCLRKRHNCDDVMT